MRAMKTKTLSTGILLAAVVLRAATNDLTSTLQKGLFEEEANHNLDAAAQAYQAVSAQFDKDRKLAATAIFRLGEVYRKQGRTNDAVAQYERIVREFSERIAAVITRDGISASDTATSSAIGATKKEVFSLTAEIERLKSLNSGA